MLVLVHDLLRRYSAMAYEWYLTRRATVVRYDKSTTEIKCRVRGEEQLGAASLLESNTDGNILSNQQKARKT